MTNESETWTRFGKEDVLSLVRGLWFPIASRGEGIVAFAKTSEIRDLICKLHNDRAGLEATALVYNKATYDETWQALTAEHERAEALGSELTAIWMLLGSPDMVPALDAVQAERKKATRYQTALTKIDSFHIGGLEPGDGHCGCYFQVKKIATDALVTPATEEGAMICRRCKHPNTAHRSNFCIIPGCNCLGWLPSPTTEAQ